VSDALSWLITALVAVLLVTFALHVWSLGTLGTRDRPSTPTYDRFGRYIGMEENPDYRENPGAEGPEKDPGGR
jgi:hypothetical protein